MKKALRAAVFALTVTAAVAAWPRPAAAGNTYAALLIGGAIGAGVGAIIAYLLPSDSQSSASAVLPGSPARVAKSRGPSATMQWTDGLEVRFGASAGPTDVRAPARTLASAPGVSGTPTGGGGHDARGRIIDWASGTVLRF